MTSKLEISIFYKRVAIAACVFVLMMLVTIVGIGCASAQESTNGSTLFPGASTNWIDTLPKNVQASILWKADHEKGDLTDWEPTDCKYPGGGVLNTQEDAVTARATTKQAHSGRYSAEATITGAIRAKKGNRAVRLMRWTDRPWDEGGKDLPKSAYYSTWMFFPKTYNCNKYSPWDPGDGGWWNVFQFKANDENDVSQPMWALNVYHDDDSRSMSFYLYSPVNEPASIDQPKPTPLPVGRWFHVEAFYKVDAGHGGEIVIWQDGKEILRGENIRTAVTRANENATWGIGNYTDHIASDTEEGTSTIFFDDAIISTRQVSELLTR